MDEVMAITKALADANRLRAVMFLKGGELCVCQIIEALGLAPSTVSAHLNILHRAGLIESRKDGRWIYYRLAGKGASTRVRAVLRWLDNSLKGDSQVAADAKNVKRVCRMSLDDLCCRYKGEK